MQIENVKVPVIDVKFWQESYGCEPFKLDIPIITYGSKGKKILVVIDRVANDEIKNEKLLSGTAGTVLKNIVDYAIEDSNITNPISKLMALNFHCFRINHLAHDLQVKAEKQFFARVMKVAAKFKPDCIIFFGTEPFYQAFKAWDSESRRVKRMELGRVKTFKYEGVKYKCVGTLSLLDLATTDYEKKKSYPALCGYASRHVANALRGRNLYTIDTSDVVRHTISNLKEFDKFFAKLSKAKIVCLDTEGTSLNRLVNTCLSFQFALSEKECYFLPWAHHATPFSPSDLEYMRAKLCKWVEEDSICDYVVYANAKFDLIVLMNTIKARFIKHRTFDVQAGEFSLDENRKFLEDIGIKPYTLETLTYQYGSNIYATESGLTKSDRGNMISFSLEQIEEYGWKDVICPFQIHKFQIAEAARRGRAYDKFMLVVCELISDMNHSFAGMEYSGIPVDIAYLAMQSNENSEISQELKKVKNEFRNSKAAIATNKLLLKGMDIQATYSLAAAMGGSTKNKDEWVFDIAKEKTKQTLFFKVLGLDPLEETAKGGGKTDKAFQEAYKSTPEVAMYTKYNKYAKLKSTFIDGMIKQYQNDEDALKDGRFRPNFNFVNVLTGRSGASGGFHQIPSRGPVSKIIKRQFVALRYYAVLKADFSAHEVRGWGNVSRDTKLCGMFKIGLNLRRKIRILESRHYEKYQEWKDIQKKHNWFDDKNPLARPDKQKIIDKIRDKTTRRIAEYEFDLEIKGDIHRLNYEFFYGVPPDQVNSEQRQSIKSVVFGVTYGKGAKSLAIDIWKETEPSDKNVKEAQKLIDKLYDKFRAGGKWLKDTMSNAKKTLYVISPLGRVRHLSGYMHHDRSVHGDMDRRGPNSSIQGTGSDLGFTASRLIQVIRWALFERQNIPFTLSQNNAVHDSTENQVHFVELPLACYLMEHAYTTQVHKRCRKVYDFQLTVDLEMEFDFGGSLASLYGWDFTKSSFMSNVEKSIDWCNANLGHNLNKKSLMLAIEHNYDLIAKIRLKELENADANPDKVAEEMLLTSKYVKDAGFIFANDFKPYEEGGDITKLLKKLRK